jgi:hypothetical protein
MPLELGLMDSRQAPSSQLGGHLPPSDTPHTAISSVDPGSVINSLPSKDHGHIILASEGLDEAVAVAYTA